MKLYRLTLSDTAGGWTAAANVEEHYIAFGCPGLGDLERADERSIRERLLAAGLTGELLDVRARELAMFAGRMNDGDYIAAVDKDNGWIYWGDLGDYFYAEGSGAEEDGSRHRRGVTWLKRMPCEAPGHWPRELRDLLNGEGALAELGREAAPGELERWLSDESSFPDGERTDSVVDAETIREAVDILRAAMRSGDPERRERAAVALLQFAASERRCRISEQEE